MAEYTRFEIFIPVFYTVVELDSRSGKESSRVHQTDDDLINLFRDDTCDKFEGITQANPTAGAIYKGWWKPQNKNDKTTAEPETSRVYVDYSTVLFGLIKISQTDEAIKHFDKWKKKFEEALNQEVILVLFYPVKTIGDFF